jgi:mannose-6-phosphate isomerase-like protein (cupin superfamily)
MAGHEASGSLGKSHAAPHVHDVPEIWVAPSEKKGDLVIEAEMDDDKFLVEAPFSIFIPPGIRHCFTVVKSESPHFIMGVVLLQGLTSLAFSAPRKGAFLNSPLT